MVAHKLYKVNFLLVILKRRLDTFGEILMSSSLLSPSQASQVTLGGTVSQWPSRKCIFTAFFSGTGVRAVRRITDKRAGKGVHLSLGDIPFGGGALGHPGSLEQQS